MPRRPVGLPLTARVHQHGGPNRQRGLRAGLGCFDRPVPAQARKPWRLHHQAMGKLKKGRSTPKRRQKTNVNTSGGADVPAGMVADEQHRSGGRDPAHATNLRTEPGRNQRPDERNRPTDVTRIAPAQTNPNRFGRRHRHQRRQERAGNRHTHTVRTPRIHPVYSAACGCTPGRTRTAAIRTTRMSDPCPQPVTATEPTRARDRPITATRRLRAGTHTTHSSSPPYCAQLPKPPTAPQRSPAHTHRRRDRPAAAGGIQDATLDQ